MVIATLAYIALPLAVGLRIRTYLRCQRLVLAVLEDVEVVEW